MTRFNTIDVALLSDQHLLAERRELPRIASYIAKSKAAGTYFDVPPCYKLGIGHVKFFYNKAPWLLDRQSLLEAELTKRGLQFSGMKTLLPEDFDGIRQITWFPTDPDHMLNADRILRRVLENPLYYTRNGKRLDARNYVFELADIYGFELVHILTESKA